MPTTKTHGDRNAGHCIYALQLLRRPREECLLDDERVVRASTGSLGTSEKEKKNNPQSDAAFHMLEAIDHRVRCVRGMEPGKQVIRSSYEWAKIWTGIYVLDGGETLLRFLSSARAHQGGMSPPINPQTEKRSRLHEP